VKSPNEQVFVYLAYLDDSDTKAKQEPWQVLSAVLIPDSRFSTLEMISGDVIRRLMGEDEYEEFIEFHACELYKGYGIFEKVDQDKRLKAIEEMLRGLKGVRAKVAYGAVHLAHLKNQPYASASPLDIAFRLCLGGIEAHFVRNMDLVRRGKDPDGDGSAILIADEFDKGNKAILQRSFRSMRPKARGKERGFDKLALMHDDIYFGDSRYSIGIQMADLCSYFIAKHLAGEAETDHFYNLIEPLIISGKRDPQK
jgi:Protein of unknown function (DUF3800)